MDGKRHGELHVEARHAPGFSFCYRTSPSKSRRIHNGIRPRQRSIVRTAWRNSSSIPTPSGFSALGIVGVAAGELIAEGTLAIEMGALASDLKMTIHPHPTLSETVMEAADVFFGESAHVYKPKRT